MSDWLIFWLLMLVLCIGMALGAVAMLWIVQQELHQSRMMKIHWRARCAELLRQIKGG